MKSIVRFLVILGLISVTAFTSCAKPANEPSSTTAPAIKPTTSISPTATKTQTATPTGPYGELRIALNSFQTEQVDHILGSYGDMTNVFSPMLEWMFRSEGSQLIPGVIEKWELAPDGLFWTYYVTKGIKFHNGEDLTAADIKFSLDRFTSAQARYADLRTVIQRSEVVDDYTVRLYTSGKQPFLPTISAFWSPGYGVVMPKDYIEQQGIDRYKAHPVGAGPFKFVRHVAGDLIEYEALNTHWRQTPNFKKLSMILVPEETTRMAMVKTGSADVMDASMEAASEAEASGLEVGKLRGENTLVHLYGTCDPRAAGMPTTDIRVRQALSLAIDRQEINKTLFYGVLRPVMPPWIGPSSMDVDVPYWMDYAAKVFRYDPDEAKRLLAEAGYSNGFNIRFYAANQSGVPYQQKLAEVIHAYWKRIGVNGQLIPMDWGGLKPMLQPSPVAECVGQAAMASGGDSPMTVKYLTIPFHSKLRTYALLDKSMPELDSLIDAANVETDTAKRRDLIAKAIKMSAETFTAIPIGGVPGLAVLGPRVSIEFPALAQAIALYADIAKHKNQ